MLLLIDARSAYGTDLDAVTQVLLLMLMIMIMITSSSSSSSYF